MDIQVIYRAYRPLAVELAEAHGVELSEALHALVRAATHCPNVTTPLERNRIMRLSIEHELKQGKLVATA